MESVDLWSGLFISCLFHSEDGSPWNIQGAARVLTGPEGHSEGLESLRDILEQLE